MSDKPKMDRLETKSEEVVKLVHEVETSLYYLKLESHLEDMELRCSFTPLAKELEFTSDELLSLFEDIGVQGSIDQEAVKKFCHEASRGKSQNSTLLVKGISPKKGDDQRIEFLAKPSSEDVINFEAYDEQKDYHNLHLFDNVEKDQLIAEVFWATDGSPGVSVLGQEVEAMRGLMFKRERRPGKNVRLSDDDSKFYAEVSGRILYDEYRGIISVSDLYEVRDDVGYKTGNVDFIGHVVVNGDVNDTYNIKAGLSLKVNGHVGNSQISCGGDIEIIGVDGKGEGKITCEGNFKARYVHEASVEAKGDLEIIKESVNSNLCSEKVICATHGSIIGGDSIALCGIEVGEVGSDAHIPTKLTAGISYVIRQKIQELREELVSVEEEIAKMNKRLNPFVTNPRNLLALNDDGREKIKELAESLKERVSHKDEVGNELKDIREVSREDANPMINIMQAINPRVSLNLGTSTQVIKERQIIKATVLENSIFGGLRYTPTYRITRMAKDIEAEIVEREQKQK